MNSIHKNKKLYTKLWSIKNLMSHKFWVTWKKFEEIIPEKDPRLLDIGCGVRPRIPTEGSYFLDLSQPALDLIGKKGGICHCGDAADMPYENNFFDLVNASELLEHIETDGKVFREVNRILKPQSYFSFSVPLHMKDWTRFDDAVNHVRRYEPEELYKKINDTGFSIKYYYTNNPTKSSLYKNFAAWFLSVAPQLAIFLEHNVTLPITERIQKNRRRKWYTDNFIQRLQNASGVIVICQKV
ncbi:class I SAM-dependent methyltransferase [Candidatus Dojkabacteria bacterium]|nr:class I SAM-dependent methyltransferase [Candidatus Dojkabacteria bacterium]